MQGHAEHAEAAMHGQHAMAGMQVHGGIGMQGSSDTELRQCLVGKLSQSPEQMGATVEHGSRDVAVHDLTCRLRAGGLACKGGMQRD